MKILVTGILPPWALKELTRTGAEVVNVPADVYVDEAKFCEGIKGFDVYISGGIESCTAKVINSSDVLKKIIFLGVDYKVYIDADAAAKKGIVIYNTPGANSRAVAELTIMLMLMAARKAAKMLEDFGKKEWKNQTGTELKGKRLGLIGSGPIAQQVSIIARGLGMRVSYWSRSGAKEEMKGRYSELQNLLSKSDILSLHIPKSAGLFLNAEAINKLKKGAILVNTSSAELVDPASLHAALSSGRLACAAFDSFYAEGAKVWESPQRNLFELGADRFFITPHAGWRTREADDRMFEMAIEKLHA
jgi:phosphoglycerate dehydrogenase-like enzyme